MQDLSGTNSFNGKYLQLPEIKYFVFMPQIKSVGVKGTGWGVQTTGTYFIK